MIIFIIVILVFTILAMTVEIGYAVIAAGALIVLLVINYTFRNNQINDAFKVIKFEEEKKIHENIAEAQLSEFKMYLAEVYPNIEKAIFTSMKPDNIQLSAIKYPEIKSEKTIMKLVSLIDNRTSSIYNCDLEKASTTAKMRARYLNAKAWCFPGVVIMKYNI